MNASLLIAGYYGAGNLGDEAILAAMIQDLRTLNPEILLRVLSWNPGETSTRHSVKAVHWGDVSRLGEAVRSSDLILVGGGGLFQDLWGMDPDQYLRRGMAGITTYGSLPLLADILGIPCMLYCVGIGPLLSETARRHTREAALRCRQVTVRDHASYQALLETGYPTEQVQDGRVRVLADPAFRLVSSTADRKRAEELWQSLEIGQGAGVVGINLRYWLEPDLPERWIPRIARGVADFTADHPGLKVLLIPFQLGGDSPYTDDLAVCQQLKEALKPENEVYLVDQELTPGSAQTLIGRCSLFVGMRYHSLLMALNQHVPAVGLPYDPKVTALMTENGLGAFCAGRFPPTSEEVAGLMKAAWKQRDPLKEQIRIQSGVQAQAAREAAKLAGNVLEDHRGTRRGLAARTRGRTALALIKILQIVDGWLESWTDEERIPEAPGRFQDGKFQNRLLRGLEKGSQGLVRILRWMGKVEPDPHKEQRRRKA